MNTELKELLKETKSEVDPVIEELLSKKMGKNFQREVLYPIRAGGRVRIFTPYHQAENEWIKKLIQKIKNPNDHDSCSCSILQDKTKARLQLLEFDALVIQHMITSRFWLLNGANDFSEIPQFFLRAVTRDLLTNA